LQKNDPFQVYSIKGTIMATVATLEATLKVENGTGSSRALRRTGKIPAVIYGGDEQPQTIAVDPRDILKGLNQKGFYASIVDIIIDGKKSHVIPKAVQFHPISDAPIHVDFLRVTDSSTITVSVPIHFLNQDKCKGVKAGGILNIVRHSVEVIAPAARIPAIFEIDLLEYEIADSIKASVIALPADVKFTISDRDFTIATIVPPKDDAAADKADADAAAAASAASTAASEAAKGKK
jgi:large subunit ribosomal protein L25